MKKVVEIDISFLTNIPEKTKEVFNKWYTSYRSKIEDKISLDKDFDDFGNMNKEEIREEYKKLYDINVKGDRFRRLSMFIALHWVYEESWNEKGRLRPAPPNHRSHEINPMVKFDDGLIDKIIEDSNPFRANSASYYVGNYPPISASSYDQSASSDLIPLVSSADENDTPIDFINKASDIVGDLL